MARSVKSRMMRTRTIPKKASREPAKEPIRRRTPTMSPKTEIALRPWETKATKSMLDFPAIRGPRKGKFASKDGSSVMIPQFAHHHESIQVRKGQNTKVSYPYADAC